MIYRTFVFSLVLSAGFLSAPVAVGGQVPDSTVTRLMADHSVPGLTLAVIDDDSTHLYGWGRATAEGVSPVTPDTPFRIASVAKALVAATVLLESQVRGLDLRTDVEALAGFPLRGDFSEPVTLHDLLTHTGGFDERMVGYAARGPDDVRLLGEYLSNRMPHRGWPTGEIVAYSNHGMSLAAYAIERVAGRSFAEVASTSLFAPLEMTSTRFIGPGVNIPASGARALVCEDSVCETQPHVFSHTYPAGFLFSTARDMGRFITAIIAAGGQEGRLADLIPERFSHDPRIPGMSYGLFNQTYAGHKVLAHSGSAGGYWALLLIIPEERIGFFFAANGGDSRFGAALRDSLLKALLGEASAPAITPRRLEDPSIRAGSYELTRYSHRTIERLPQLFHNSIRLRAVGDTLLVFGGGPTERYLQVDDSLYQEVDGERLLAFGTRREKPYLFRASDVYGAQLPAAYEGRSWFHGSRFMNEYLSWLFALPILMMVLLWPVLAVAGGFLRKRRGGEAERFEPRRLGVTLLTTVTAMLFGWFGFGFTARSVRLLESGEMLLGMPEALTRLLWIPYAHVAAVGLLILVLPVVWKRSWWNLPRRLVFSLMVGACVLQALFFVQWNYLPATW